MWNCQGARKKQFKRHFKELCRTQRPKITVVVEPRVSGSVAERIISGLGYNCSHRVEARGFADGIWLMWNDDQVEVQILYSHTQLVHVRVSKGSSAFFLTVVYASPQEKWRRYCWKNIEALAEHIGEPWLLVGDFNAVLDGNERKDRFGRPGRSSKAFQECISTSNLMDLDFSGGKFTWRGGGYRARLDRFLCNEEWRLTFTKATVFHLSFTSSNHRPIIIKHGASSPDHSQRPFRFQAA
ncbi:hypothetical protein Tsubulata_003312 [Turnera subulata]|uniref:Endonuclease/exonuclease/phosphatase domain-containing protein n=1 Tax=Turnera subulata TaxID=218843 RepID=A0A9Q0GG50_9ROSI|nr:hypothetical protein Tsubulata_003312 [Turnera subulata]